MKTHSLLLVCLAAGPAFAQGKPTPLLEDDLSSNKRTKIDAGGGDGLDAGLDAAFGGGGGFSTKELEKVEDRLRADLKRERPRATPRLVLFLYPGRVDAEKLRSLAQVNVDMELIMDPCERSVCREAVGRHIELVGRALGKAVYATQQYKLTFKTLTLRTATTIHDTEVETYLVPITDCIAAAARPGGGVAWLDARKHAADDYVPLVEKAIARQAAGRRVSLSAPPQVRRTGGSVDVTLKVRGDRNRAQQQVLDALAAAAAGLKENPTSPAESQLEVLLDVGTRPDPVRTFRSPGQQVGLFVEKRLDSSSLWSNYVEEVKKQSGAQRMAFDDAEASGRAPAAPGGGPGGEAGEPDDNQVIALLADNFAQLGGCAKNEAAKNPRFRGVTVTFKWLPSGRADGTQPKEAPLRNTPLAKCLAAAMSNIRLPRFSGGPREIEYPIRVK
jgi:hypothetical protein